MSSGYQIAIVGMAIRAPGAADVAQFWRNLLAGELAVKPRSPMAAMSPQGHWVDTTCLLDDGDAFDAGFFGYTPSEAAMLNPQHRLLLELSHEALEDAGLSSDKPQLTGIFAGAAYSDYGRARLSAFPARLMEGLPALLHTSHDYLCAHVAHRLGLRGPSVNVQAACSTSLLAVHLGCQALLAGDCDAVLAGAASIFSDRRSDYLHVPGGMLSPDGLCRAFDAQAAGTVYVEGGGMVALMRLEDALASGRSIHAIILGSAVNNDGDPTAAFVAPSQEGLYRAQRRAHRVAGISSTSLGLIEAHGTGTLLGDAIEISATNRVLQDAEAGAATCALGSLKTNIGHLSAAAGVASLIKAALAVKHGQIPATLHFQTPNPDLEDGPLFVNARTIDWPTSGPRRAGVSTFGMGGANAHVVIEAPPTSPERQASAAPTALMVSARTANSADSAVAALRGHLLEHPGIASTDAAHTLAIGRRAFAHRRIVLASDGEGGGRLATDTIAGEVRRDLRIGLVVGRVDEYSGAWVAALHAQCPTFRDRWTSTLACCPEPLAGALTGWLGGGAAGDLARVGMVFRYLVATTLRDLGVEAALVIGAPAEPSDILLGRYEFDEGLRRLLDLPAESFAQMGLDPLGTQVRGDLDVLMNLGQGWTQSAGATETRDPDHPAVEILPRALGALWVLGARVDWSALLAPQMPKIVSLPTYRFERQRFWAPDTGSATSSALGQPLYPRPAEAPLYVPVATPIEAAMAVIWTRLFGFGPIGREDNFFELGGESLLGMKAIAEIHDVFGVSVTFKEALNAPIVRELSMIIASRLEVLLDTMSEEEASRLLARLPA